MTRIGISRLAAALAVCGAAVGAVGATTGASTAAPAQDWSHAVTRICTNALLFDGRHPIGTRAGAIAVARDIRSSTERRLGRVGVLPAPAAGRDVAARWLVVERRLAAAYARSYLGIFDAIAAADTPGRREEASRRVASLLRAPDRPRSDAARLEEQLEIPDCTGGAGGPSPSSPSVMGTPWADGQ